MIDVKGTEEPYAIIRRFVKIFCVWGAFCAREGWVNKIESHVSSKANKIIDIAQKFASSPLNE
ncbi:hypothetical protein T03_17798 [Trichinella britovi]|uniref:Uncharacterized protein n=1 Tax=Trichinella britovi TaxID=45882 RepID=A0A0V0YZI1_TRIBR|nr:hypothetical protein T03_17798 [Trichinella britovi]